MIRGRVIWVSVLLLVCSLVVPPAYAVDIIWVHEDHGPGFDVGWKDLLAANGHNVENRILMELDQQAIDDMNASPLVIFSRDTNSGNYDDGDEPQQWNGITAPMIVMTPYVLRSSRWNMVNNTSIGDVTANLEAIDSNHSIFDGVPLDANNQVPVWDDTALGPDDNIDLVQTTDFGNGTVIAQEAGSGFPWIVHWNAGDEFYAGSGTFAGGPRLYLSGGSDDDPNSWGGENFTPAGEQLLLNAINVMAIPEPSTLVSAFIGLLLLGGCAMRRRAVR